MNRHVGQVARLLAFALLAALLLAP